MVGRCPAAAAAEQTPRPAVTVAHPMAHQSEVDLDPLIERLLRVRNSHGSGGVPSLMFHFLRSFSAGLGRAGPRLTVSHGRSDNQGARLPARPLLHLVGLVLRGLPSPLLGASRGWLVVVAASVGALGGPARLFLALQ